MERMLTAKEILDYEIRSSLWAQFVGVEFLRNLASHYFAWKVRIKYKQYLWAKKYEGQLTPPTQEK